jgi:hypothetical protein
MSTELLPILAVSALLALLYSLVFLISMKRMLVVDYMMLKEVMMYLKTAEIEHTLDSIELALLHGIYSVYSYQNRHQYEPVNTL